VLAWHGARVLDPESVTTADGWPAPQSTVYRAHTLLLPPDLHEEPALRALNEALAEAGMSLASASARPRAHGALAGAPRAAVLSASRRDGLSSPAATDAWKALTALRAAALRTGNLDVKDVRRISLEHLLVGAAITGEPVIHSGAVGEPVIHSGAQVDGSYLYGGVSARTPVEMAMDSPARRGLAECRAAYGRRPVIAVLDSGVRVHPWLGVTLGPGKGDPAKRDGYATAPDGFVRVDQGMQDLLHEHGQDAVAAGDSSRRLIRYPWDAADPSDDIIRPVDSHMGHGTFIAGLIRQVVPDATVLSVRIMQSDGIVYEGDLLHALQLIAERVKSAHREGNPALMIDAVSLSLGYFNDSAADVAYTSGLRYVIDELLDLGVMVTAAAGNYTTRRRYYPAAFAADAPVAGRIPLVSVGALNPNGTSAAFSDGGAWVHGWASGAAVVSTFPVDVNGPSSAPVADGQFQGLDSDDFSGGFAAWSGTSFAAPVMAARLVGAMLGPLLGAAADRALRLDVPGAEAAVKRAESAMRVLQLRDGHG
jgi:hypothetical protein